ncbi:MAG: NAD-dependent epimerase/dehydratase family protein [Sporichthyaceae bacterium]
MTVVVTGSAGFLGRAVVARLLAAGRPVLGIDRLPAPVQGPGHRELCVDLLDADPRTAAALRTAGGVVHLAGCPGVRDRRPDVAWHRHRDNVLATAVVLAATDRDTPVVVSTSSSIYGGSSDGRPCREDDALRPRGGYARSKAEVEALCQAHNCAGGRVVLARPFTVAGEGQRPDMALALWIEAALAGRPLRILGSPDRTRDLTDVRQVARALVDLLNAGIPGPVNVGTGVGHSLAQMVAAVGAGLGLPVSIEVEPAAHDEVRDTLADTTRLRELIGWAPSTDLADLVARQIASADASRRVEIPA